MEYKLKLPTEKEINKATLQITVFFLIVGIIIGFITAKIFF